MPRSWWKRPIIDGQVLAGSSRVTILGNRAIENRKRPGKGEALRQERLSACCKDRAAELAMRVRSEPHDPGPAGELEIPQRRRHHAQRVDGGQHVQHEEKPKLRHNQL